MTTIWKFPLAVADRQRIQMPKGAKVLTVQRQGDQACLWAIVNEQAETETRVFDVYGTGNPMPDLTDSETRTYIGTFQVAFFVWHVFEIA